MEQKNDFFSDAVHKSFQKAFVKFPGAATAFHFLELKKRVTALLHSYAEFRIYKFKVRHTVY